MIWLVLDNANNVLKICWVFYTGTKGLKCTFALINLNTRTYIDLICIGWFSHDPNDGINGELRHDGLVM